MKTIMTRTLTTLSNFNKLRINPILGNATEKE